MIRDRRPDRASRREEGDRRGNATRPIVLLRTRCAPSTGPTRARRIPRSARRRGPDSVRRPIPAITVITTAIEGLGQQRIARRIRQLVQRERSHQGQRLPRKRKFTQIDATNSRGQSELVVRTDVPRKAPRGVDRCRGPLAIWRTRRPRPRQPLPSHSRDPRLSLSARPPWESFYDATHDQMMKRAVEQRERRALAATGQRSTVGESPPALDVDRRQGTQRARDLRKREVSEVARFERRHPVIETQVLVSQHFSRISWQQGRTML